jgi:hypothetical protein
MKPGQEARKAAHPILIAGAIGVTALLFCWPAFYNGFPLVYGDTASYLDTIDPRKTMWARQIFYTAFLRLLHWHISLWPAVLVQSLITSHLLYLTLRVLCPALRLTTYLLVAALLTLATSLPWHTSALLPDFFTPIVVLGFFLLAFRRPQMSNIEIAYVAALTTLAIICHLSHVPLAIGLIAVIVFIRLALRWHERNRAATAALLIVPVLFAVSLQVGINYVVHRSFSLSPASSIWLLARFIGDGPARAYLREECPQRQFILCAYLDKLPADSDEFLWGDNSYNPVFRQAGGYAALHDEAREIVRGTLATYPGWILRAFVENTAREFVDVGTGGWINFPPEMLGRPITKYIEYQFPDAYPDYLNSLQVRGRIPTGALATGHRLVVIAAALACCAFLVIAVRRRQRIYVTLCALLLAALLGNAMVTGGISAVHDRYQTRVAWLIVLAAAVGALTCQQGARVNAVPGTLRSARDYGPAE